MASNCIFCKIVKGIIPCHKLLETEKTHKDHAQYLHQVPDDVLQEVLPAAKKIALALDAENYNVLQNNGRMAHQAVDHVHFHIIPKDDKGGLGIEWNMPESAKQDLDALAASLRQNLAQE